MNALKGRIGEAFVENILRRAGYKVSRLGRESQVQQLLRTGSEVKYRSNVSEFLRRFAGELFSDVVEQWPELYVVVVTDNPEPGRSCFQALTLHAYDPDTPLTTIDLHEVGELGIYPSTVTECEGLVKQIFSLLGAQLHGQDPERKPLAKGERLRGLA